MFITFEETYLQDLYEKGKTGDKKHRYQPDIVRRYQKCIQLMKKVPDIESLAKYNSLNYEVLKGDKNGISSIRVNDKYRVEFTVRETMEEPIIIVCNIIDLSNHYNNSVMIKIEGVDPKMIANNLTPSEPIHPGEILKDEIEYRGISQRKLAAQMGISPTLLNEILNGKRAVSAEYALLFEAALGIDAEPLIKLQVDYNIQVAKSDKSFLERLANIRKIAAVL